MPVYSFRGKSRTGTEVRGEREADTKQALVAALRREQISPLVIKEKGKEFTLPKFGGKGMYGEFVHDAVLTANEKESGPVRAA